MHILLFGGSFDPVHTGHIFVANSVVASGIADAVWFVPCYQHPFGKSLSSAKDRLAMLRLVPDILVERYELKQTKPSYTIDTLRHFSQTQPQHTFSWLVGSDQLPSLSYWHQWEELITEFSMFVYPREGYPFDTPMTYEKLRFLYEMTPVKISSTLVREQMAKGAAVGNLVPAVVAEYSTTHGLYVR